MGVVEDIKAKLASLDQTGDGTVNYDDVKKLADEYGLGDQLDQIQGTITGPDGKVNLDDATRLIDEFKNNPSAISGQFGGVFAILKDKFLGK